MFFERYAFLLAIKHNKSVLRFAIHVVHVHIQINREESPPLILTPKNKE
jgi:hypothetical protein